MVSILKKPFIRKDRKEPFRATPKLTEWATRKMIELEEIRKKIESSSLKRKKLITIQEFIEQEYLLPQPIKRKESRTVREYLEHPNLPSTKGKKFRTIRDYLKQENPLPPPRKRVRCETIQQHLEKSYPRPARDWCKKQNLELILDQKTNSKPSSRPFRYCRGKQNLETILKQGVKKNQSQTTQDFCQQTPPSPDSDCYIIEPSETPLKDPLPIESSETPPKDPSSSKPKKRKYHALGRLKFNKKGRKLHVYRLRQLKIGKRGQKYNCNLTYPNYPDQTAFYWPSRTPIVQGKYSAEWERNVILSSHFLREIRGAIPRRVVESTAIYLYCSYTLQNLRRIYAYLMYATCINPTKISTAGVAYQETNRELYNWPQCVPLFSLKQIRGQTHTGRRGSEYRKGDVNGGFNKALLTISTEFLIRKFEADIFPMLPPDLLFVERPDELPVPYKVVGVDRNLVEAFLQYTTMIETIQKETF